MKEQQHADLFRQSVQLIYVCVCIKLKISLSLSFLNCEHDDIAFLVSCSFHYALYGSHLYLLFVRQRKPKSMCHSMNRVYLQGIANESSSFHRFHLTHWKTCKCAMIASSARFFSLSCWNAIGSCPSFISSIPPFIELQSGLVGSSSSRSFHDRGTSVLGADSTRRKKGRWLAASTNRLQGAQRRQSRGGAKTRGGKYAKKSERCLEFLCPLASRHTVQLNSRRSVKRNDHVVEYLDTDNNNSTDSDHRSKRSSNRLDRLSRRIVERSARVRR